MTTGREKILAVTADESFARSLDKHLRDNGYDVDLAHTAEEGVSMARRAVPSLILADRRQPALTQLREAPNLHLVPLVSVQPSGVGCEDDECSQDLQQGADMVVCLSGYRELIARMRAVLRREQLRASQKPLYELGVLRMDLDRHEVTVHGRSIDLTPKEFHILRQFLESPQRALTRQELLNRVWGEEYALEEHALDVHIHSLRHKIEQDPSQPTLIVTVRGVGYKLKA